MELINASLAPELNPNLKFRSENHLGFFKNDFCLIIKEHFPCVDRRHVLTMLKFTSYCPCVDICSLVYINTLGCVYTHFFILFFFIMNFSVYLQVGWGWPASMHVWSRRSWRTAARGFRPPLRPTLSAWVTDKRLHLQINAVRLPSFTTSFFNEREHCMCLREL